LLWWLVGALTDRVWPATSAAWYPALLLEAVFLAPTLYLLSTVAVGRRTWALLLVAALLLLGAGTHYGLEIDHPDFSRPNPRYFPSALFLVVFVLLFHCIPFSQNYLATGRWRAPYTQLFLYSWRNALQLALAAVFTGVFWLLLWVWIELFNMLGIHFPQVLFTQDSRFSLLVAAIVFSAGFHLAGSADRLLLAIRQQVLALLKWLALVATLIVFVVALLVRSPQLMATHRHVIRATWLLWLAVITIYLFNAGYQDGQVPQPYPDMAGRMLRYATPLLLLIAGMATYELIVRAEAYGLTVQRVWGLLVAVLCLCYAALYTRAAWQATPWMQTMGLANVFVALALIVALGLMLSPLLAPERLAANSLAGRILSASPGVDAETYMVLRFDTGQYGNDKLRELSAATSADPTVRQTASAAVAVKENFERFTFGQPKTDPSTLVLESIPANSEIDSDLKAKIAAEIGPVRRAFKPPEDETDVPVNGEFLGRVELGGAPCTRTSPCPVLFIDLDGDSTPEAVAFWGSSAHIFKRTADQWSPVSSVIGNRCHRCDNAQLVRELKAGHIKVSETRWKNLQVGNDTFIVTEASK
jgi:hypothetical protein